jgi:ABC-type cobalamin/Fe3+-siderophores transport systems, ATPase components
MQTASDADTGDDPVVVAEGIDVSLGGVSVLSDLDVTALRGTVTGIVGPNGAGKTTLLRALQAGLSPDSGSITVAGEQISELSARRAAQLVASVPQTTALSFDFTVRETVEMGRTPHITRFGARGPEDRAAVSEAMERTETAQFADRSIQTVSGGQRQRVLLARALAQETPVLLLDEPTSDLDINHAISTLEMVRDLVDDGKTALAAIHDLNLAARYCDRVVLVADGRVRASGTPDAVLTRDTLHETFDAESIVVNDPVTGAPRVTPLPDRSASGKQIHVIGRGERAASAVGVLVEAGHTVTVGPVPEGDIAARTAAQLDCRTVTAPPFSSLAATVRDRARKFAADADTAVIAGPVASRIEQVGNQANRLVHVAGDEASMESVHGDGAKPGVVTLDKLAEAVSES